MIRLNSVCKYYETRLGPRQILDNVNLIVSRGQKVGVLGANGAGKSTLIRIISGSEKPSSGSVKRELNVSWPLAQAAGFQGSLSGADNLRLICRIYGVNYQRALQFVLDFSELGSYIREPVKTYSSGMSSRLAFAVSMAVDFDCLLIDEIISAGDVRFREKCNRELLNRRESKAIILVSHNTKTIKTLCDTALVLSNGRLLNFHSTDAALEYYEETLRARPPKK